jgi:hypothetical protein
VETVLCESLTVARALERMRQLQPSDWVEVGVALLVADIENEDVLRLASLDSRVVSGWDTDAPTRNLFERYSIAEPSANEATKTIARLLATDLRARPTQVSSPMIRMIAKLAPPAYESDLANDAFGAEEYLDCDCVASVDDSFEAELEGLAEISIPDDLVRALARSLRSTRPTTQPPHH